MEETTCHFHPNRTAISKCEKCGKIICLECKKIHRVSRSSNSGSSSYRYEYCPECNYEAAQKSQVSGIVFIFIAIIMFVVFASVSGIFDSGSSPFGGPPPEFVGFFVLMVVVFLGAVGYTVLVKVPKKIESTKKEYEQALGHPLSNSDSDPMPAEKTKIEYSPQIKSKKINHRTVYCSACGQKFYDNIKFCPNCGDSTADEYENLDR